MLIPSYFQPVHMCRHIDIMITLGRLLCFGRHASTNALSMCSFAVVLQSPLCGIDKTCMRLS